MAVNTTLIILNDINEVLSTLNSIVNLTIHNNVCKAKYQGIILMSNIKDYVTQLFFFSF